MTSTAGRPAAPDPAPTDDGRAGSGLRAGDADGTIIVHTLPSVPNFRDLAGTEGYVTPHGPMRRGVVFRSSTVDPSPEDLATLGALGIVAVHDLRGRGEIDRRPDTVPAGAIWRHLAVPGLPPDRVRGLRTPSDVRDAMVEHYRGFVSAPHKRAGIGAALAAISAEDGPQVFHCAEGKDRTGWIAMLLQRLAGVSDADIVRDYLLTNERMQATGATLDVARAFFGDRADDFFRPAMIADAAYLEAGTAQLEKDYGDLEGYLRKGLGLSDDQLDRLRSLLVG
ncbi:tyrosine-protein phosphatase [Prauserella oleivorans]|uniref:tyrosine-protein phosphatase n=1 Tax=Prauserella oleivorans TaxID=1478153 RepID=UPI00366E66AF